MRIELTPLEARIIGCLIEKEITTPDQYPLSLNALTAACNQKSNRDPVLALSAAEVQATVDGLMKKHLVTDRSGGVGGRVTRYRHRFCNTQFAQLQLAPSEQAIICELLLRGAQTPGELRSRAARMAPLREVAEVESALQDLARRDEPLVACLPREPGKRESRWMQLFTGEQAPAAASQTQSMRTASPQLAAGDDGRLERLELLEIEVDALRRELEELRHRFDAALGTGP